MNEQAMRLLSMIGEVDSAYVEEHEKVSQRKRIAWISSIGAVAACAVIATVSLWPNESASFAPIAPTDPVLSTTSVATAPTASSKIIFVNPGACYSSGPAIGEAFVEDTLLIMLEEGYGENGRVPAEIVLHDDNGPILHSEAIYNELDRLKAHGYELYILEEEYDDYWGAPKHITHIVSYMTRDQIESFPVGDQFAYWISYNWYSVPIEEYTLY